MKFLRLFLPLLLCCVFIACSDDDKPNTPAEETEIEKITDKLGNISGIEDFTSAFKSITPTLNISEEKLTVLAAKNSTSGKKATTDGYTTQVLKRHIIKGTYDLTAFTTDTLKLESIGNDALFVTKSNNQVLVNGIALTSTTPSKAGDSYIYVITDTVPTATKQPESTTLPANLRDGITILSDDSLAFVLFAPKKERVHLIGDFNEWTVSDTYKMKKDGDRFWIKIGGLEKGKEYVCQYLIDNTIKIADPYASKISDPSNDNAIPDAIYPNLIKYPTGKTTEIAMVVNTAPASYSWKVSNFSIDNPDNMVIYEILIRDFTKQGSIKAVEEKIDYLKTLGVNAIELMPFNEFEGNNSWGYNPSFYFAADKAYGTSNDYKSFIDVCHSNGIAVIMDMVLNHSYGQSPMVRMYKDANGNPTADNPWYNQRSNFANPDAQWGCDFNHESEYTKAFVDSVCSYWMKEYKVDGFRFDFTKGFSNTPYPATGNNSWGSPYDADRIKNLERIYNEMKKRKSDVILICEHLSDNDEETKLAELGIKLWGNLNYNFNEATMGWGAEAGEYGPKGDVSWGSYLERGWKKPNLVAYMESHDEERIMFKNKAYGKTSGGYDVKDLTTGLKRTEAAAVILMSFPGPKMIWQFGELGYDEELNNDRLGKKPPHWEYYDVPARKNLYDVFAKMNKLRNSNTAFSASDYTIDTKNQYKQILLKGAGGYVCAIANLDVVEATATVNFGKTGNWEDYFSGDKLSLSATTQSIKLQPGEYRLYMSK
ncbi:alpha-amylase [Dysgonomonas sp. 521]|uniref:alpha-amylase family glycosyl hydrolase n=1 Tax=Dysgonomonas sp. 521 TaxID=2302932 RepID=UPI0013D3EC45|nr:alpha-amylase family glycosyl hydrolase [Dysgonomonas sp. 521]NDV95191.1 alpha-amylase [Dysgonomonas sp. 521]